MTVTAGLIADCVILVVLLYYCILGFRRGAILTLCSLLAVFVALAGGWILSSQFSKPLQDAIEPYITERLIAYQEEQTKAYLAENSDSYDPSLINGLSISGQFSEAAQERLLEAERTSAQAVAHSVAGLAAQSAVFLIGFTVILLLWYIICHALNLVAKLPGLHFINRILGAIIGLIRGLLILLVIRWLLCDLLGWIPSSINSESILLPILSEFSIFSLFGL